MAQLRQDYQEFVKREAEVIVVGPENTQAFKEYWQREQLPFIGLADADHSVANLYGQEVRPLKLGRMPALFVIDKWGQIRYRHYGESMSDIPTTEEILAVLGDLGRAKA